MSWRVESPTPDRYFVTDGEAIHGSSHMSRDGAQIVASWLNGETRAFLTGSYPGAWRHFYVTHASPIFSDLGLAVLCGFCWHDFNFSVDRDFDEERKMWTASVRISDS